MTRQNRVLPTGEIVAHPARGTLTGNRGCLHDAAGRLGPARWRHRRWIACLLSVRGRRREVMAPGRWTELFFLDEAVALAAGHRPCAQCRREDHGRFRDAWAAAFGALPMAGEMDAVLHPARVRRDGSQVRTEAAAQGLPDGTFVLAGGGPLLLAGPAALPFAPEGYGPPRPRPAGQVIVLTPAPILALLAAGYAPALHPSAGVRRSSPTA